MDKDGNSAMLRQLEGARDAFLASHPDRLRGYYGLLRKYRKGKDENERT